MSQVSLDNAYADLLPEDEQVLPNFGVRLVAFYDTDGNLRHDFSIDRFDNAADAPVSMLLGVLELLKIRIASVIED